MSCFKLIKSIQSNHCSVIICCCVFSCALCFCFSACLSFYLSYLYHLVFVNVSIHCILMIIFSSGHGNGNAFLIDDDLIPDGYGLLICDFCDVYGCLMILKKRSQMTKKSSNLMSLMDCGVFTFLKTFTLAFWTFPTLFRIFLRLRFLVVFQTCRTFSDMARLSWGKLI